MANLEPGQPASLLSDHSPAQRQEPAEVREEIESPTKLVRIAHMLRALLDEVRATELDEAARQRLADIQNRSLDLLRQVMSPDLAAELDEVTDPLGDGPPSGAELRVAQAQLIGWLEGLFRGIQASIANQQLPAQQRLQRTPPGRPLEPGQGESGQYL